jgi:TPR repeat protein
LYYTGFVNVVKNQPKAMELFKKAADPPFNNCVVAQCMLGMTYLDGNEAVKKDVSASLYWFSQSANNSC